jgi:cell division protein FtsI/penicillin-binding protein 2
MKTVRRVPFILTMLLLAACSKASGGSVISIFGPSPTLPPPQVGITPAPSAQAAMTNFLTALKNNDFASMYAMLSKDTQAKLAQDKFTQKYTDALDSMGASALDYQVMSQLLSPSLAQVGFRIIYHTAFLGDIQRDLVAHLIMEGGQWRLQWDDSLILPELSGGNVLKMEYQIPARGDIYDQNGQPIVTQSDAYALGIQPGNLTGNSEFTLVSELSTLCNRTPDSIKAAYASAAPEWYVAICDTSVGEAKSVLNLGLAGLVVNPYSSRFYLGQGIAPQVVGYASLIHKENLDQYRRLGYRGDEKVGQAGIEKSMEQYLAGKHGGTLYVVDPNGQIVTRLGAADPQPANSVYLTIDSNLQHWAQTTISGFRGAAVVIERDTGRVLAMASSPSYDQNLFDPNNFNSSSQLGDLVNDPNQPLVNRATQGTYPLGSAFKPITMAAALESGLYLPITTYDCQYDFTELTNYGGPVLHDWTWEHCQTRVQAGQSCNTSDSQPSGLLTLEEGLMRSCDPYFWHIGLDLFNNDRAGDIAAMAKAFGLGQATGINDIAEATGDVPVPAQPIDATNQAIGQGNMLVSPLQVARFVAAIGNGGTLYRPQLIQKIQPVTGAPFDVFKPQAMGTLPLRPDNLAALQQAMTMVVNNPLGTAHYRMLGLNFPIAGKTGTAQSGSGEPHAWFIGYTVDQQNSGKPDIAIAVILENAGEGSDWAAPVFRALVETYYYGSPQAIPWFGPFQEPFTATPQGANPSKTPKPAKGKKAPTPTP